MKAFLYCACAINFSHFVLYPDYRISFFMPLAFRFADYIFTFIFFLFVLHDGLRWETGTDWGNYYRFFLNCLWDEWEQFEPGYVLFNQLIRGLTIDYNVFLLCEAVIVWGLIFPTIRKYSPDPLLTLFCLYCTLLPVLGMNRQLISLAISIYSIRFILNRQWIFFICLYYWLARFICLY